jgi:phage baseplate assembly protein V
MTKLMFGIISSIDIDAGTARVYFEEDDFVSAPLQISVMRSGPDQVYFPFNTKEHVWCMMDEHCEYGVIGGAIYDDGNKPSGAAAGKLRILFADNSAIEYDRNTSTLTFDLQGKVIINCTEANLTCTGNANIHAIETNITGILNVTGAANISGVASVGGLAGISGAPVDGSTADLNVKSVTATEDITATGISLTTHTHIAPSGGGVTGPPE